MKQRMLSSTKGNSSEKTSLLTTRGTIGNTAYFNLTVPFENLRINSGMVILRCDKAKVLPAYLYHFLRSPSFHGQVNCPEKWSSAAATCRFGTCGV